MKKIVVLFLAITISFFQVSAFSFQIMDGRRIQELQRELKKIDALLGITLIKNKMLAIRDTAYIECRYGQHDKELGERWCEEVEAYTLALEEIDRALSEAECENYRQAAGAMRLAITILEEFEEQSPPSISTGRSSVFALFYFSLTFRVFFLIITYKNSLYKFYN